MDDNNYTIVSNNVGPNGEPVDRIYGGMHTKFRLVQADYTEYKGNITKKTIYKELSSGERVRTHVYVTDDDRWFDRGGLPILKPHIDSESENDPE